MGSLPDRCGLRGTARRRLGLLVVGGVAFAVTASLVRRLEPPLRAPTLSPQLEAFLRDKDDYDAVFIGSSRVQRDVRPDVIDPRLSSNEKPFRSFNLGVAGMESFEADRLVREVLASKPARLRFLIVEAPSWSPQRIPVKVRTERFVDWHDLRATMLVLGSIWKTAWSVIDKLDLTWRHLRAFLVRSTNYATGERFFNRSDTSWTGLVRGLASRQGYVPLDERVGGTVARRRRQFLKHPAQYEERVRRLVERARQGRRAPGSLASYDRSALARQVEEARRAGVELVYVVLPGLSVPRDFERLRREGAFEHLIDLRNPLEHPDLYVFENHFDSEHLNQEGARRLSERLAAALAPLVRAAASEPEPQHAVH